MCVYTYTYTYICIRFILTSWNLLFNCFIVFFIICILIQMSPSIIAFCLIFLFLITTIVHIVNILSLDILAFVAVIAFFISCMYQISFLISRNVSGFILFICADNLFFLGRRDLTYHQRFKSNLSSLDNQGYFLLPLAGARR